MSLNLAGAPDSYIYRRAATPAWNLDTFGDARHSVLTYRGCDVCNSRTVNQTILELSTRRGRIQPQISAFKSRRERLLHAHRMPRTESGKVVREPEAFPAVPQRAHYVIFGNVDR